jgi:hypothetical protein
MTFTFKSNCRPLVFLLKIRNKAKGFRQVRVISRDANLKNTVYTDRFNTLMGDVESFFIRMPITPMVTEFEIINNQTGKNDPDIELVDKEVLNLETRLAVIDFSNKYVASFIRFALEFSEKAGILPIGDILSDDGLMMVHYTPKIVNDKGKIQTTPARVNSNTKHFEISEVQFKRYTVAGRFAILAHEFAHIFENENVNDEEEADYHAATIYLALGFPRVELLNVFAQVFDYADTSQNRRRYEKLEKYIMEFDQMADDVYRDKNE